MDSILNFAGLVLATIFAAAVAVACNWLILRTTFHLMQPAAARRATTQNRLVPRTVQLARALTPNR